MVTLGTTWGAVHCTKQIRTFNYMAFLYNIFVDFWWNFQQLCRVGKKVCDRHKFDGTDRPPSTPPQVDIMHQKLHKSTECREFLPTFELFIHHKGIAYCHSIIKGLRQPCNIVRNIGNCVAYANGDNGHYVKELLQMKITSISTHILKMWTFSENANFSCKFELFSEHCNIYIRVHRDCQHK